MIVSDSSPLVHYSRVGRLTLLTELYDTLFIPRGVVRETVDEAQGRAGVTQIQDAIKLFSISETA